MNRVPLLLVVGLLALAALPPACSTPGLPDQEHFPLTGRHHEVACGACHTPEAPDPLPETCAGCHEPERPVPHDPGDCGLCHGTTSWGDAVVDHTRYLSLDGGHAPLACGDCHQGDGYGGLDARCASCHEADRPAGHYAGGCESCHVVAGWEDAEFDHRPFFPVPHHGVRACESCHPEPEGTASFTCTGCHEHRQSEVDSEHRGMSGYSYTSEACLRCHPRGDD